MLIFSCAHNTNTTYSFNNTSFINDDVIIIIINVRVNKLVEFQLLIFYYRI